MTAEHEDLRPFAGIPDGFTWREDDHCLRARCTACGEEIRWTHHARQIQVLADVTEHAMACPGCH
jgi:hypothetical protein